MSEDFIALPLGAKIYAYCIIAGSIAFFVLGLLGFCGWSIETDEKGKKHWKAIWVKKYTLQNFINLVGLDRICHFALSIILTMILAGILFVFTKWWSLLIAFCVSFAIGGIKELIDKNSKLHALGDLAADFIGSSFGVLFIYIIISLIH